MTPDWLPLRAAFALLFAPIGFICLGFMHCIPGLGGGVWVCMLYSVYSYANLPLMMHCQ
jgi:hypothetical protein